MMLPTFASCQQEKPFPDDAVDKVYEYLPEWQAGYLDIHQVSTGRGNAAYLIFPDGTTMLLDAGDLGVHTIKGFEGKGGYEVGFFREAEGFEHSEYTVGAHKLGAVEQGQSFFTH